MAGILRNRWPRSIGIDGRNRLESVAGINRNRWPESIGISGRNGPEYAGQTIAAIIAPLALILICIYAAYKTGDNEQIEVLKIITKFVLALAGIFLGGRALSALENIFSKKDERND